MRRRGLLVAALALALGGCSPAPTSRPATVAPVPEPEPERITAVEPVITVRGEGDAPAFVVRSAQSELEVQDGGGSTARLADVTGEIYRGGAIVSRFKAERAQVDQAKKTLVATGSVQVTEERRGLRLTAARIDYSENRGRIEAEGAVTVSSQGAVWGPFPVLWANPELTRFASPDKF